MKTIASSLFPLLATTIAGMCLTACGGGGGGGSSPLASTPAASSPASPPTSSTPSLSPPYTVKPGALIAKQVTGYPATINVKATPTTTFVGTVYFKLSVANGVFDSVLTSPNPDGSITFTTTTPASTAPGHYVGNVTVNACKDPGCTVQLDGSPFQVPYVIDVVSPNGGVTASNLTHVSALSGAGDWGSFQGNAAHTGMVPVTLNPAAFTVRWHYEAPATNGQQMTISDVATGNGLLYFSASGTFYADAGQSPELFALKESDGSQAWVHGFGVRNPWTNPPAFANGNVYVLGNSDVAAEMFAFDASTGAQLFGASTGTSWQQTLAPVVFGGSAYSNGGADGSLQAFDAMFGAQQMSAQLTYLGMRWTPAVDATNTYVYIDGLLWMNDRLSGKSVAQIIGPDSGWPIGLTPLLGAQNSAIVAGTADLMAFDTAAHSLRWQVAGSFHAGPAYDNKTVYVLRDKALTLEAHNEADGSLAWSWTAPAAASLWLGGVLLTNNLVFVSTDVATYAIDRTTHATVWSIQFGGELSMSANGILYINSGTSVHAVNLK